MSDELLEGSGVAAAARNPTFEGSGTDSIGLLTSSATEMKLFTAAGLRSVFLFLSLVSDKLDS